MVMVTSLLAAGALFTVFFGSLALVPAKRGPRVAGTIAGSVAAGAAWTGVVTVGRALGWVTTEEAQFHHLYVLGAVGLPVVGVVLLAASVWRPVKDRRARLGGRLVALLFVLPAFVGFYATNIEPGWLQVQREQIGEGGLKVAVVADVQTDRFGQFEDEVMAATLGEEPDVIIVPGDLTQVPFAEYPALVPEAAATLGKLEAPGGVFVVSGNTDPSPKSIGSLSDAAGLTALDDEIVEVTVDGHRVRILGISWPNNRRAAVFDAIDRFVEGSGGGHDRHRDCPFTRRDLQPGRRGRFRDRSHHFWPYSWRSDSAAVLRAGLERHRTATGCRRWGIACRARRAPLCQPWHWCEPR